MVGTMSLTWWNWFRIAPSAFYALRPAESQRVACAAEVAGHQLGVVKRRAARPRPAGVIHVVGSRAAPQRRLPPQALEGGQLLLLDRAGNVVLRQ